MHLTVNYYLLFIIYLFIYNCEAGVHYCENHLNLPRIPKQI